MRRKMRRNVVLASDVRYGNPAGSRTPFENGAKTRMSNSGRKASNAARMTPQALKILGPLN